MTEEEVVNELTIKLKDLNHFLRRIPKENYNVFIRQIENSFALSIIVEKKIIIPYIFTPLQNK